MSTLGLIILATLAVSNPPQTVYERALHELSTDDFSLAKVRTERKLAAIRAIWGRDRGSAPEAMPHLLKYARRHRAYVVREAGMATACKLALTTDIPAILDMLQAQREEIADAKARGDKFLVRRLSRRHGCGFWANGILLLPDEGRGSPELLQHVTHRVTHQEKVFSADGRPIAAGSTKLAMRLLPNDEARSRYWVEHVRLAGSDGVTDYQWGELSYDSPWYQSEIVKNGLRQVVQDSIAEGQTFNRAAAGILADWGDLDMLPILRHLQAVHGPEFAALQIRKIQLLNSPTELLEIISSEPSPDGPQSRTEPTRNWAMGQAVRIGLPHQDIVQAIQTYCDRNIDSFYWRGSATMLKSYAVLLGLIQPTDLPNVPYYTRLTPTLAQQSKLYRILEWFESGPNSAVPPSCDFVSFDLAKSPPPEPYEPPQVDAPFGDEESNRGDSWQPNEANYEIMVEWMGTVDWGALPLEEGFRLFEGKMCELDLISPETCQGILSAGP